MTILFANTVWEGLSTEMKPAYEEGARDGQFYKELDTGESYIRKDGIFTFINLGLSFIKATKSGKITTDVNGLYNVIFVTPFINNNYAVSLSCEAVDSNQPPVAFFSNITANGFTIITKFSRTGNIRPNTVASWVCTRYYNP